MPRGPRSSQPNGCSQRSQRSQVNYNEQAPSQNDEEKNKRVAEAASKLVAYVLHNLDNKKILRQTAVQKHVAVKGVNWTKQFKAANTRLMEIYGCELVVCEDPSVKVASYYIRKTTPHINISVNNDNEKRKKIVTFLLMTIIFMSNGKCSERNLFELFCKLSVIDEDDDDDNYVKDVLKELNVGRVVEIENDCVSWGPLAEVLVNKMEILEFVSKVYGTKADSWVEQYASAMEQVELNRMDEEDDAANGDDCEMVEAGPSQKSQGRRR